MVRGAVGVFCVALVSGCAGALQGPVALTAADVTASERDGDETWDPGPEVLEGAKVLASVILKPELGMAVGMLPVPDWSDPDLTARLLVDGHEVCRLHATPNSSTARWRGAGLCRPFEISEASVLRVVVADRDLPLFDSNDAVGVCEFVGPIYEHNVSDEDDCAGALESVTLELRSSPRAEPGLATSARHAL